MGMVVTDSKPSEGLGGLGSCPEQGPEQKVPNILREQGKNR